MTGIFLYLCIVLSLGVFRYRISKGFRQRKIFTLSYMIGTLNDLVIGVILFLFLISLPWGFGVCFYIIYIVILFAAFTYYLEFGGFPLLGHIKAMTNLKFLSSSFDLSSKATTRILTILGPLSICTITLLFFHKGGGSGKNLIFALLICPPLSCLISNVFKNVGHPLDLPHSKHNMMSAVLECAFIFNKSNKADLERVELTMKPGDQSDFTQKCTSEHPMKPNVLIICVESLPGCVFSKESISSVAPNIERLLADGLKCSKVLAQNKQTDRGTFSILTGVPPILSDGDSKMAFHRKPGLPGDMQDLGYKTAYMQSSDLAFMDKRPFLEKVGYDDVEDIFDYPDDLTKFRWGLNDKDFYAQVYTKIQKLKSHDQPWFLHCLNTGTHHPYDSIPADYQEFDNDYLNSISYADKQIGLLRKKLEGSGDWKNLLVVIVSDEAKYLECSEDILVNTVSRNWCVCGFHQAGVVTPNIYDKVFTLSDVRKSLLDLMGVEKANQCEGVSCFSESTVKRDLPFHYDRNNYFYRESEGVLYYNNTASQWFKSSADSIFAPDPVYTKINYSDWAPTRDSYGVNL